MAFITPYKVIRSKRKTIALQVNSEAALIVRVPMRFSLNYVEQIIQQDIVDESDIIIPSHDTPSWYDDTTPLLCKIM